MYSGIPISIDTSLETIIEKGHVCVIPRSMAKNLFLYQNTEYFLNIEKTQQHLGSQDKT